VVVVKWTDTTVLLPKDGLNVEGATQRSKGTDWSLGRSVEVPTVTHVVLYSSKILPTSG